MKIVELKERAAEWVLYLAVVCGIKKDTRSVLPKSVEQAPSTAAALKQTKAQRKKHNKAPIPKEAQVTKDDGKGGLKVDVNERSLTVDEILAYKAMQRSSRNTLGQSTLSVASAEMRAKAFEAYMKNSGQSLSEAEKEDVLIYYEQTTNMISNASPEIEAKFKELVERSLVKV